MMAQKAYIFMDNQSLYKIMDTDNPREQKRLGRQVKNFDAKDWDAKSKLVVERGNIAKFAQNYNLSEALRNTKGTTLVEASPYDKIWGIGLTSNDPRALNRATWLGENRLGFILTNVRKLLYGE